MMGAEGIKELLKKVDIEGLSQEIRDKMKTEVSQQKKLKFEQAPPSRRKLPQNPATSPSG